jgi:hypothetical protein
MEYNGGSENREMRVSVWVLSEGDEDGCEFEKGGEFKMAICPFA